MVNFPLFQKLSSEEQKSLINNLPSITLEDGEIIFENGDNSTDIYFILQGAAKSVNFGPEGQMAYFRLRAAGDFFGYYSAISGEPRTARMIAVGKTVLAKMTGNDFMKMVTNNPEMSDYMLKLITKILREETKRITGMITMSAKQQVCAELLVPGSDIYSLESRNEMAARLGITRETLSRILHDLERLHAIEIGKNSIILKNPHILQEIAENNI